MTEADFEQTQVKMPALFVGHGSPMNAIEDNEFSRAWGAVGRTLPRPKAILCISAHWETPGVQTTAMEAPRTIYDFYGFPRQLYAVRYPAPGSPALAGPGPAHLAGGRRPARPGLGAGSRSLVCLAPHVPRGRYPGGSAEPGYRKSCQEHYALGKELKALRGRGVLILGSGNMVHNLRMVQWEDTAYDWALEFDNLLKERILAGDHSAIVQHAAVRSYGCLIHPDP